MKAATAAQRPILVLVFITVCLRGTDCVLVCDCSALSLNAYGAPLLSARRRAFLLAPSPCQRVRLILPRGELSGIACLVAPRPEQQQRHDGVQRNARPQ